MPINRSENKIRVIKFFGVNDVLGVMDPVVNMQVHHGIQKKWIVSPALNHIHLVNLAIGSGGTITSQAYTWDILVESGVAVQYGWPTATGCVLFGHEHVFPSGVPYVSPSGFEYFGGDGLAHQFTR